MSHVAPTSHRRAARASHRGHRRSDRAGQDLDGAYGITEEEEPEEYAGPIQTSTWVGLTIAFVVGMALTAMKHVGVHAAGVTLQVMLVPVTIGVIVAAFRRGFGSVVASLAASALLMFVLVRFFFF